MLNPANIVPDANKKLSSDIDVWAERKLFGIKTKRKPLQFVFAQFLILTTLNNPYITTAQTQECLAKLLTLKNI